MKMLQKKRKFEWNLSTRTSEESFICKLNITKKRWEKDMRESDMYQNHVLVTSRFWISDIEDITLINIVKYNKVHWTNKANKTQFQEYL